MVKRILQMMVAAVILCATFASAGSVAAASGCAGQVTVQWGDTLSGIAQQCGTTVAALQSANPGLGWWVYAGQVLSIPTGPGNYPPGGTYVVQSGDTLGKIAGRLGVSWLDILALNPQIYDPSLIYVGQVISVPGGTRPPSQPPAPCYNCAPQPPPACNKGCPPPPPGGGLTTLKINYKYGLYIRTEPNGKVLASALNKQTVYYYPGSLSRVGGCVWVKVKVFPPTKGYYEGWLLVKDQLGTYFTSPQIN